mmetsp:Transcript_22899/g.38944  ORF Transcript_22899/g.38944 Transcript_22899/m.38944 type:complete len:177 (+) Transcript_22899:230-760(+)
MYPIPGLRARSGADVLYMNPSRLFPKRDSVTFMVDHLTYMMGCMLEREHTLAYGICIVADFSDFTMANFTVQFFHRMLLVLQGRLVPTRVEAFLIVNPPPWFGNIWAVMKPMMSTEFMAKVPRISFNDLGKHLMPGYEQLLPNDIWMGRRDAKSLMDLFIQERKHIERARMAANKR